MTSLAQLYPYNSTEGWFAITILEILDPRDSVNTKDSRAMTQILYSSVDQDNTVYICKGHSQ